MRHLVLGDLGDHRSATTNRVCKDPETTCGMRATVGHVLASDARRFLKERLDRDVVAGRTDEASPPHVAGQVPPPPARIAWANSCGLITFGLQSGGVLGGHHEGVDEESRTTSVGDYEFRPRPLHRGDLAELLDRCLDPVVRRARRALEQHPHLATEGEEDHVVLDLVV